jgi:hypothetical protein
VTEDELLKLQKSGQFPGETVKIKDGQIHYHGNLPDVLVTGGINESVTGGLLL